MPATQEEALATKNILDDHDFLEIPDLTCAYPDKFLKPADARDFPCKGMNFE
jgi:hypothetical protein